jgi:2-(1,2-epoxy-1,2-dihydrophenyl)acetyl-CoA isomerase
VHELEGDFHGFTVGLEPTGIAVVTLNRPDRLNSITLTMKRELSEWLVGAQVADSIRVVVITGAGRAFSAGDDISGKPTELAPPRLVRELTLGQRGAIRTYEALRVIGQPLSVAVRDFDKPTVAAVNGVAVQSGLGLLLACDFRLAAESASFISGTLRFAFTPDDGSHYLLVRQLGYARAMRFIMLNETMSAQAALAHGIVSEVLPSGELTARALELAGKLASGPQIAMRLVKRSLQAAENQAMRDALDDVAIRTAVTDYQPDAAEGVAAFREKRPAVFNAWLDEAGT